MCTVVPGSSPVISQSIPGYVIKQSSCCPCMCLCSVFSTVSPLGRYLPKALSFPRSLRLWGRCACAELLDDDRIDGDSVFHSCPIDGKWDKKEDLLVPFHVHLFSKMFSSWPWRWNVTGSRCMLLFCFCECADLKWQLSNGKVSRFSCEAQPGFSCPSRPLGLWQTYQTT